MQKSPLDTKIISMKKYKPGNRFSKRISLADAAVEWMELSDEEKQNVSINDAGFPELLGNSELHERAEALYEAGQDREISGQVFNEDGYPLRPWSVSYDRESVESWTKMADQSRTSPDDAARVNATLGEDPDQGLEDDQLLDQNEVAAMLKWSTKTLKRRRDDGSFPAPVLDKPLRWKKSIVIAHIAAQMAIYRAASKQEK